MILQRAVEQLASNPRRLFLIDGLGALVSAFLLGIVLVRFENIFGIPEATLYFLAFLPCLFAIYDYYCYLRIKQNLSLYLKIISIVNVLYCCISIGLAFYHYQSLSYLGWIYILLEVLIVLILAKIEFSTAVKLSR